MDSSFFLTFVAAAIGLFTLLMNFRFLYYNKEKVSSSSSPSSSLTPSPPSSTSAPSSSLAVSSPSSTSALSSSLTLSSPSSTSILSSSLTPSSASSSLSRIWEYHVFPSFRGEDVRRDFLSHILAEFRRMGITPFIDNEITRGESIGPELIGAIRESKIAVVLLSRNYASSTWCLDELAEIMKCREDLGQTVLAIFYRVDPSDVKKLRGDFGKVFKETCAGKNEEDIGRWKEALGKVATIAGYHSSNWDNEATMIKKIATDISNKLNNSTPSSDFDGLVGMRAHLEELKQLLCLDSNEVRMIGIWGPPGIGKTTIARAAYNQLSSCYQLSVFMDNIKKNYARPCFDDYSAMLQLQQQFMSHITTHNDMEVSHLGVAQHRLKDKKVFVVLDGVDHILQLDAMAKKTWWFGPGSRIIITTQDQKLFRAHGINHVYEVAFPEDNEALQIFCMYAFGQKSPKAGFEELAWKVTRLVGNLPLGLRVMGSYFKGMSKQDWTESLPKLETSLDAGIQSVLKFSYDHALDDEDKDLFLHIACFFNGREVRKVEEHLAKKFLGVRQRLKVLAEKSLISFNWASCIEMHSLLEKLGREIVRKKSMYEPGQRRFLVDRREICELLSSDTAGRKSVIGIDFECGGEVLRISERAFEGMSDLQFLKIKGVYGSLQLPRGLNNLSCKLQLLDWSNFPMKCLPSFVNPEFLVEIIMCYSRLEKLWKGIKPLPNLRWMDLSRSGILNELPDLSTATNLQKLNLSYCTGLRKLPSSIGNAINLEELNLNGCWSLRELPSSIGNAINLEELNLNDCHSLKDLPSSIGNLPKLQWLTLQECNKLKVLPSNIQNLTNCWMLKSFPDNSSNVTVLKLTGNGTEEVLASTRSWSPTPYLGNHHITELDLSGREIREVPPWVKRISHLNMLVLKECRKLVSLSHIPDSLISLNVEGCESLERLECGTFSCGNISLRFAKCFKLNEEARDLIIRRSHINYAVLPGKEVPPYFTHRTTNGGSLTIKLKERPLPTSMRFKACILLVGECEAGDLSSVRCGRSESSLYPVLTEHLYIFNVEAEVTSDVLVLEFKLNSDNWKIGECGLLQLS